MQLNRRDDMINGLILAAGCSTRMGDFKPLLPLGDKTVIETTVDSMLSVGANRVVVVLGRRGEEIECLLKERYGERVICAWNHRYESTDMLESVKCGLRVMPECEAFFLLPGDMPAVGKSTFYQLLDGRPFSGQYIVFPTLDGRRKHPPLICSGFISEILEYEGEGGLRQIWKYHEELILHIPVEDPGVWIDLDTREDYEGCIRRLGGK